MDGMDFGEEGGNECEVILIQGGKNKISFDVDLPKTSTGNLFKTIITNYFMSKWHQKVEILKHIEKRPNKKRTNIRNFLNKVAKKFQSHKCDYLIELFDKMQSLPMPKGVKHDKNYGKLKVTNKVVYKRNCQEIQKRQFSG